MKTEPMESKEKWALLTAGNEERGYNTMTVAWFHLGQIWGGSNGRPTVIVYVRPQRYTKEFIDREETFTLSFFPKEYRKALVYLGSHSGRDGDKVQASGLHPVFDGDFTYFEEANLVMTCRKLYQAPLLESGFTDKSLIPENYPDGDFHEMYIGEILNVLEAE